MNKFNGNKILDILDNVENCLNWYLDNNISNTRYKLLLSNDEKIEIDLSERALPHLLGINIDFLRSTGHYTGGASSILYDILESPNLLFAHIRDGHMQENQIFSKHIDKKLANFKYACSLNVFNIEFIAKYESTKSYVTGEE